MKIYGHPLSINVQKVMWLIDELDLSIALEEVDIHHNRHDAQALAQRCPMRQVPVLEDGPNSVWESHTILRYLVACYGNKMWYPDCAFQRSCYERWMDWCLSSFQPVIKAALFMPSADGAEERQTQQRAWEQCRYELDRINDALDDQRYLTSDRMTLADIAVGSLIHRLSQQSDWALPPNVERWYQQLVERPGYQRWVMQAGSTLPT